MNTVSIFGYFDKPGQETPVVDPGLNISCPVCRTPLSLPMVTISLMVEGDSRSYFYRAHRHCYYNAPSYIITAIESAIVDAIYQSRASN